MKTNESKNCRRIEFLCYVYTFILIFCRRNVQNGVQSRRFLNFANYPKYLLLLVCKWNRWKWCDVIPKRKKGNPIQCDNPKKICADQMHCNFFFHLLLHLYNHNLIFFSQFSFVSVRIESLTLFDQSIMHCTCTH